MHAMKNGSRHIHVAFVELRCERLACIKRGKAILIDHIKVANQSIVEKMWTPDHLVGHEEFNNKANETMSQICIVLRKNHKRT